MKKLILAVAIVGMTGFAFGQQVASNKDSKDKDTKCSKACMKSCGNDKTCHKGACAKDDKKGSTSESTTTKSGDKK